MDLQASVVICTYNRPLLLQEAVRSCVQNATRSGLRFEIVIADNSREGHAAPLVANLMAEGHPVRSVPASPPNISIARNAGLHAAKAPLVAFLDDDLEVEPGWLDHLVATLEATGADAAIGPVRPRFAAGSPPGWDRTGARFTRVLDQPTGFVIDASKKMPPGFAFSTASSIWRSATCFTDPSPFEPAFGASGGEDFDLFLRLDRRGRRFVWCAEAKVHETILPGRTEPRYQLLRAFANAQVYTALTARHSETPRRRAADIMLRGAVQAALSAVRLPLAILRDRAAGANERTRTMQAAMELAYGCGKMVWWNRVALYQVEKSGP